MNEMEELKLLESRESIQVRVIGNLHDTLSDLRLRAEYDRSVTKSDHFSKEFIQCVNTIQDKLYNEETLLKYFRDRIKALHEKTKGLIRK